MTNWKSHMRFRLVPKSSTLDDLNCRKFKFSRNFALLGIFARQQRLNEWRWTCIVSEGIVVHWKYFSTMRTLRWYCWTILSGGRFSELRPRYQDCRALTFALARLSCIFYCIVVRLWSLLSYMLIVPPTSKRCTLNRTYRERNSAVWCGRVHSAHSLVHCYGVYPRIPCFIMTNEVIIRCQKTTEVGIRRIYPNTPLELIKNLGAWARFKGLCPCSQPKTATAN